MDVKLYKTTKEPPCLFLCSSNQTKQIWKNKNRIEEIWKKVRAKREAIEWARFKQDLIRDIIQDSKMKKYHRFSAMSHFIQDQLDSLFNEAASLSSSKTRSTGTNATYAHLYTTKRSTIGSNYPSGSQTDRPRHRHVSRTSATSSSSLTVVL